MNDFNNKYAKRTKAFTVALCKALKIATQIEVTRVIIAQLVRSGTSVAANFSAATRARSRAEYYSKFCIVVEECDETVFWIDLLIQTGAMPESTLKPLYDEALELLKIFSSAKKKLKPN